MLRFQASRSKKKISKTPTFFGFCNLPQDLQIATLALLPPETLLLCSSVCQEFLLLFSNEQTWFQIYERHFLCTPKGTNYKEKFKEVVRVIREHRKSQPQSDSSLALASEAQVHARLGHYQLACSLYTEAARLTDKIPLSYFLLQRASVLRQASCIKASHKDIEEAMRLDPNNSQMLVIAGNWYREDGISRKALKCLDKAIKIHPNHHQAYFIKSLVYQDMEEYGLALKNLNAAIVVNPQRQLSSSLQLTRGKLYFWLNQYQNAIRELDAAIAIDPTDFDPYHWRGRCYREVGDFERSMKDFDMAIAQNPDNDEDYAWRALVKSQIKNDNAALEDINEAIKRAPTTSSHYQTRGVLHFGMERFSQALADYSKSISLEPDCHQYYIWRSAVYIELQDWQKAESDLDTAVRLRPEENSYLWCGLFNLHMKDYDKAYCKLQSACHAAGSAPQARTLFWLGVVIEIQERGDHLQYWSKAKKTTTEKKESSAICARIFLLQNNPSRAKNLYRSYFQAQLTADAMMIEETNLRLLGNLYPDIISLKDTWRWFKKKRAQTCKQSV